MIITHDKGRWTNPLPRESCAPATAPSEQQVCWSGAAVANGLSVGRVLQYPGSREEVIGRISG
jgi:hypothetical protein